MKPKRESILGQKGQLAFSVLLRGGNTGRGRFVGVFCLRKRILEYVFGSDIVKEIDAKAGRPLQGASSEDGIGRRENSFPLPS